MKFLTKIPKTLGLKLLCCIPLLSFVPLENAVNAALPMAAEVPIGQPLRIDGTWRISGINKRVRIEGGRAVVIDGWKHLFLWPIDPGQVVIRDIRRNGDGTYSGTDIAMNGTWEAKFKHNKRDLDVVVNGFFKYTMSRASNEPVDEPDYEEPVYNPPPVAAPKPKPNLRKARLVGQARKLGCPGKQSYFSTLQGGSCWTCPSGYKRTAKGMDHARACKKRKTLTGPYKKARFKGRAWGCPSGQFHVARVGTDQCYACPRGYSRVRSGLVDTRMCRLRLDSQS